MIQTPDPAQWQPPVPSLAALPVDKTKTEPKPAYYKLQFGDEVTGFSYYVRTLNVIIGRNCEKQPPPIEREQGVPTHPPLEQQDRDGSLDIKASPKDEVDFDAMAIDDLFSMPSSDLPAFDLIPSDFPSVGSEMPRAKTTPLADTTITNGNLDPSPPVPSSAPPGMHIKLEPESYFDPIYAPPPPPTRSAAPTDHVDVDLGPLKSVSRNHAKIEYYNELGHFCLEITGRNGAWVDDRYYVKGSIVPLNQGSQIQIATRIFSFILPPSATGSPYSNYGYEDTANALEDVPYPYNLPPTEVGYAEFYGEAGPGPASAAAIAARYPTDPNAYNVFAMGDGLGMGIEGVEGKVWDDEWDNSDEESSSGDEEDEDEAESGEGSDRHKVSMAGDQVVVTDMGAEGNGDDPGTGKRRKSTAQGELMTEDEKPKVGKSSSKKKKKGGDEAEGMVLDVEPTTTPSKKKKKDGEDRPTKKEPKKKKSLPVDIKPQPESVQEAEVATLAAVMAAEPLPPVPVVAPAPAPLPAPVAVPTPTPVVTPKAQQPTRPVPPQPVPPHVQKPTPTTSPAPTGPSRQNSIGTPTPSEPPKPFYLTELIETPGRPGHIVVNVPIPPSGAGPRPPPGPIIGLDGKPFIGPPPIKPTATFATIIHRALLYLPRGRGTLGEVCNWVAGEWEWFRLNIDAGWQNSIRHNLSLNKAFLKVPRIPEDDPESKGSVWIIDPEEGPLFEEKQRRDALKSAGKEKNAEVRREKERQKVEERMRKQRDMVMDGTHPHTAHPGVTPVHAKPVLPRPTPVPPRPVQRAQPSAVSANAKGLLQPKAKITVSIQTLTPAHRAKSVIATTDSSGNPLPFACDGTTLTLDQTTFGHLTGDIIDKLTLLGAAGAVDVLSAWVINKNKNQAARAAQQAAAAQASSKPTAASMKANLTRPTPAPATATAPTSAKPPAAKPVPAKPATGPATTPTSTAGKLPGAAPPGASLTKVIGMIAEVANAKGDVNTVGPNAGALLRYIRVVGVDIDLRVAGRIWATGVVPPLPLPKKAGAPGAPGGASGAGTPKANGNSVSPQPPPKALGTPVKPTGALPAKPPVSAASATTAGGAGTSVANKSVIPGASAGGVKPVSSLPGSVPPAPAATMPKVSPAPNPAVTPRPALPATATPRPAMNASTGPVTSLPSGPGPGAPVKRKLDEEGGADEAKKQKVEAV